MLLALNILRENFAAHIVSPAMVSKNMKLVECLDNTHNWFHPTKSWWNHEKVKATILLFHFYHEKLIDFFSKIVYPAMVSKKNKTWVFNYFILTFAKDTKVYVWISIERTQK